MKMHRRPSKSYRRLQNVKETRKIFLIVCEGEKTEPNYFQKFRVPGSIIDVRGTGANTDSLVKEAIKLKNKASYDQVWCVFDRDSFPLLNFNNALLLAAANNISVAYSNEAFELWYLLHFYYHDSATSRNLYVKMLTIRLGSKYFKNDPDMFDKLISMQSTAIKHAEKLLSTYPNHSPVSDNPSTTVHKLVLQLAINSA